MSEYICPACGWKGEYTETEKRNVQGKWYRGYCPKGGTQVKRIKK
jgi:predicted RNA-binding Zn-ribbon protein involved in translation (DUF1610 family)